MLNNVQLLLNTFAIMAIHIGRKIKQVFEKKGMTISEFGRRIHKSRENIYSIFKRKSIDTALLESISKVLEHDFFSYYTSLQKELQKLKEENKMQKRIIELMEKKK